MVWIVVEGIGRRLQQVLDMAIRLSPFYILGSCYLPRTWYLPGTFTQMNIRFGT